MRICVTGVGGFAGSFLSEVLIQERHEVHGILSQRNDRSNLTGIESKLHLYPVDLCIADTTREVLESIQPEGIFHLASNAIPSQSFQQPREVLTANTLVTVNLFEALRILRLRPKILCVSSVDVYKTGGTEPLMEHSAIGPSSPYGISKYTQELLCQYYERVHDLPSVVVRPFAFTGTRQKPFFAVPSFAKQVAMIETGKQAPVIEVGNVDTVRDYCDVKDIVRGLLLAFRHGKSTEVYNLCSGRGVSLREILGMFSEQTRAVIKIEINQKYLRAFDAPRVIGDFSKVAKDTGWQPKIALSTTLTEMLEYWRTSTTNLNQLSRERGIA